MEKTSLKGANMDLWKADQVWQIWSYSFLEKVFEAKDVGKSVVIIYLDFSKAFDKVPHKQFIKKFKAKGGSEEIVSWI